MDYVSTNMLGVDETVKRRINGIKWIGALTMILIVITVPGIILISVSSPSQPPIDFEIKPNATACVYVKRYNLSENIYLSVCNLNGYIMLDIRQFINESSTIKGIGLNTRQWSSLKQLTQHIDVAIDEARTYWKNLQRLHVQA